MVYERFLQTVSEELQKRLGPGYRIVGRQIPKNNGLVLDGLCISRDREAVAPTIYLNPYYDRHLAGMTVDEVVMSVLSVYREHQETPDIDFSQLLQFEQIREKIVYKLINARSNRELLSKIPHISYLDLALVFYIFLKEDESGQITALIYREHQEAWEVETRELCRIAAENTPRLLPARFKSMREVMKEIAEETLGDNYSEDMIDGMMDKNPGQTPLFVLTNAQGFNGACCVLYENILKKFADKYSSDLVILPSSIHEVLVIPDDHQLSYEHLSEMVSAINRAEVPAEDQLSNQIYLYSREEDSLHVACSSSAPVGISDRKNLPPE